MDFGRLGDDLTIDIGAGRIRLQGISNQSELSENQFLFNPAAIRPAPIDPPTTPPPNPNDTRVGDAGANVIPTGVGQDTLIGNGGADVFDVRLENGAIGAEPDRVLDFNYAGGDRIGLNEALAGLTFDAIDEVVRVRPVGANTEVAINRDAGFETALILDGVSFTTADLAAYGFELALPASASFVENPYGFQNNNAVLSDPDATRDGLFVAFADQTNVDGAPGDFDISSGSDEAFADLDVFVRNTATNAVVRASVDRNGATLKALDGSGAFSNAPSLSGDGRWIAFATDGIGAANDLNNQGDIYIRDIANDGGPILVSVAADGFASGGVAEPFQAADSSAIVALSADGRKVAFVSSADLTGDDQTDINGAHDVYLRDLDTGVTTIVSTVTNGTVAQGVRTPYTELGDIVAMSDDGRYVAFLTATRLDAADTNNFQDVYLRDMQTGQALFVTEGFETGVFEFDMSASGDRIAFLTDFAGDADDTNELRDVYVADINLDSFTVTDSFRVSEAPGGLQINGARAKSPVISPDGERVAWSTV